MNLESFTESTGGVQADAMVPLPSGGGQANPGDVEEGRRVSTGIQSFAQAAMEYAAFGWRVIPLRPRDKRPLLEDWPKLATCDEETIAEWWGATPDANVGVQLGKESGIIDIEYDSPEELKDLCELFGVGTLEELPETASYSSSRGKHLLFRWNDSLGVPGKAVLHFGKLAVRVGADGKGAQSVFPPSIHPNGARYTWVPGREPDTVGVAELPEAVIARLVQPDGEDLDGDRTPKARDKLYEAEPVREGNRHKVILSEANALWGEQARLRPNGWLDDDKAGQRAWTRLASLNAARCEPPLPEDELRRIFSDAKRHVARRLAEEGGTAPGSTPVAPLKMKGPALTLRPWEPFPIEFLPEPLKNFVKEAARAIGVDVAYVAGPILGCMAGTVGNTRQIEIKPGWCERLVLWVAIVGDSGTMKSPALDCAAQSLKRRQAKIIDDYKAARAAYDEDLEDYKAAYDQWKKTPRNQRGPRPVEPTEPVCRRIYCSDTTVEALADRLQENPRGLLVIQDELAGWLKSFDQYKGGKGADAAHWLNMHGARDMIVDRKTGDKFMALPKNSWANRGFISIFTVGFFRDGRTRII